MHSTRPLGDLYKPHIDGLRALAITSVVIYHAFPEFLSGVPNPTKMTDKSD